MAFRDRNALSGGFVLSIGTAIITQKQTDNR
jgi:hypothetical protein